MLTGLRHKLTTYQALGLRNLLRVGGYRVGLRTGWHPVLRLDTDLPPELARGPVFRAPPNAPAQGGRVVRNDWQTTARLFGSHVRPLPADGTPPDWHASPFDPRHRAARDRPWHRLPDFAPEQGDIKAIWEASRLDWALAMAQREEIARLNTWLADWVQANPPYLGANWKCGQEASLRVLHLAVCALMLDQAAQPEPGLRALIRLHLHRIAPTLGYAIGQANNHGISEAAALFVGGHLLGDDQGLAWARMGRRWLEDRAAHLIAPDGSFSQYSLTYHRMMLDTLSLCETWRQRHELPAFSARFLARARAACDWLHHMIIETRDGPNLGANDGALILALSDAAYRDFGPCLQLAAHLFCQARALAAQGPWDQPALWLGLAPLAPDTAPAPEITSTRSSNPRSTKLEVTLPKARSKSFDDGGYHVLRAARALAMLRYPRFRFRPSQADALHVDLWHNGINLLRDAGTYSYNAEGSEWFSGTAAHNTIEFDGRNQMPRLGRFLFGDWLKTEVIDPVNDDGVTASAAAAYTDAIGARHHRAITLSAKDLTCRDTISGNFKKACLRWRLAPGEWHIEGNIVCNGAYSIAIEIDGEPICPTLSTTVESRYYQKKTEIPEVSVKASRPGKLVTKVTF